jgi:hypothetical protein
MYQWCQKKYQAKKLTRKNLFFAVILKATEEKRKSRIRIRIREPVVQVGDPEHCLESVKILTVFKSFQLFFSALVQDLDK